MCRDEGTTQSRIKITSVQGQVATGGLHGVWKIFSARSKKEGESVMVNTPRLFFHNRCPLKHVCTSWSSQIRKHLVVSILNLSCWELWGADPWHSFGPLRQPRDTRLCCKAGAQNKVVSAWILDKRPPAGVSGSGRWEAVVELCRKDAAALTRLKHPSIVKVSPVAPPLPHPPTAASQPEVIVKRIRCYAYET